MQQVLLERTFLGRVINLHLRSVSSSGGDHAQFCKGMSTNSAFIKLKKLLKSEEFGSCPFQGSSVQHETCQKLMDCLQEIGS